MQKPKDMYLSQKRRAAQRGIVFSFTFDEWVTWWEDHLGYNWMKKRGCGYNQYVMARLKDQGSYKHNNVKCILAQDNHKEANLRVYSRGWTYKRLDELTVRAIYKSTKVYSDLVDAFGVDRGQIQRIKNKSAYRGYTKSLDEPGRSIGRGRIR